MFHEYELLNPKSNDQMPNPLENKVTMQGGNIII